MLERYRSGRHAARMGAAAARVGAANFRLAGLAAPIVGAPGVASLAPLRVVKGSAMAVATLLLWFLVTKKTRVAAPARRRSSMSRRPQHARTTGEDWTQ